MRATAPSGRELIAVAAVVSSATAAVVACYLLVDPTASGRQFVETDVPSVRGLDPLIVAAIAPAMVVTVGVTAAVLYEGARQAVVARDERIVLETRAIDDAE